METGYDLNHLVQQARSRWLNPGEVLFILQNHDSRMISQRVSQQPTSGSLFLYNKNNHPSFRRDGHNWRKKPKRNCANESHERLKVDNVEALNCYYAKGEANDHFRRRSYWMLDGAKKHIVLVQYRDINEGTSNSASNSEFAPRQSKIFTLGVNSFALENQGPASLSDMHGSSQSLCSPHSVEVNSRVVAEQQRMDHFNTTASGNVTTSLEVEMLPFQLLEGLAEQLGLNCEIGRESISFEKQDTTDGAVVLGCGNSVKELDQGSTLQQGRDDGTVYGLTDRSTWQEIAALAVPLQAEKFDMPACLEMNPFETNILDCCSMLPDPGQLLMPQLGADSSVTIIPEHKFDIREISPEWCFADEVTKVIIIGSFGCDPSEFAWAKFGDIEVPIQIIQDGVICCQAPLNSPGKVTFCIMSSNRESCSEVKDFEYRDRNIVCNNCVRLQQEENRNMEEINLLVKFGQMLLSDSSKIQKGYEYSRDYITEALLTSCGTSSGTIEWLLQELLKDKLRQWLFARSLDGDSNLSCTLSKKEQGLIHIVAGLGYEWALDSVLGTGVGVNFRDTNGWTALHWAARFGREKIVAVLIAHGASACAITHPTAQEPMGKTPASIADAYGHKGLAGYLSELALTTQLSSLTFEEARSVHVEAENDVSNIPKDFVASAEDQSCINEVLAASRNAVQAAALIQEAFRVHSFKKRRQRDAANHSKVEEYGLTSDKIQGLSALFPHSHNLNVAALTIQKCYRGWKRRNYFLTKIPQVVKIQAHIRGYRVRKYYRVVWAVGIMEKIVLRWRRKGTGLRGYRPNANENEEDGDILRVFRRKKVDTTLREAVERVRSMIRSREARGQYSRMLETFRQAKAKLVGVMTNTEAVASLDDAFTMDNDNIGSFQLHLEAPPDSPNYSELWS